MMESVTAMLCSILSYQAYTSDAYTAGNGCFDTDSAAMATRTS